MFTRKRWQFAAAVICGTLLIVLPLTIRNAIVFHRFIPLSLGAGQTFLEGIADYDKEARFGVPSTDMGIMKQEAEIYQRPDYYGTLFNPDGVERERARLSRGFGIVRSHPFWFAGVMGGSIVNAETGACAVDFNESGVTIRLRQSISCPRFGQKHQPTEPRLRPLSRAQISLVSNVESWLAVTGSESNYGDQFAAPTSTVNRDVDYALVVSLRMATGRIKISVKGKDQKIYSSAIVEAMETIAPTEQPVQHAALPFVARENEPLQIVLSNETSNPPRPAMQIGSAKLFELGPARFLWTRYPRFVTAIQRIFITAVLLPTAIIGLLIMILKRQSVAIVVLSLVPIYFFTVQSAVHTEYRYVIAVTYFLFAFAGVAIGFGVDLVLKKLSTLVRSSSAMKSVPSA